MVSFQQPPIAASEAPRSAPAPLDLLQSMLTPTGRGAVPIRPPRQATNSFLWAMREDWAAHTTAERIHYVHAQLNVLRDPLTLAPDVWGDLALAEMDHAQKVLTRLLPFLIGAANAESDGPHQGFTNVTASVGPDL